MATTKTKTGSDDTQTEKKPVAKKVDPHQYIAVRNGFQGRLVYRSKHTGELYVWDEFGAEQDIELQELKNAKNSAKKFFVNNWFLFDEDWVIDYLGVRQFYRYSLTVDNFDDVFTKTPEEIAEIIGRLSEGQKRSIAYRAKQLIAEGEIDSNKAINALEKSLGIELIERV